MRTLIFTLFTCLSFSFSLAQNVPYNWIQSFGDIGSERVGEMNRDAFGNLLFTGYYNGSAVNFGSTTLPPPGAGFGLALVKMNPAGVPVWASTNIDGSVRGVHVEADAAGNVFCAGEVFGGTVIIGTDTFQVPGQSEGFLGKWDASGNPLWAKKLGETTTVNHTGGIAVDNAGNVYATGVYRKEIDLIDTVLHAFDTLSWDVYVVKYNPNGQLLWARSFGGPGGEFVRHMDIDGQGNLYLSGSAGDSLIFGSIVVTTTNSYAPYLAKMDSAGNAIWADIIDAGSAAWSTGMAVNNAGEIYMAYRYNDSLAFPNTTLYPASGLVEGRLVKLNTTGNVLWDLMVNSATQSTAMGEIALSANEDKIALAGNFSYSTQIAPGIFLPANAEMYTAVYDTSANLTSYSFGISNYAYSYGITFGLDDAHYTGGIFSSTLDIGSAIATSNGGDDIYIVKGNSLYNTIKGNVFRDFNANGNLDAGEYGYPGVLVAANWPYFGVSRLNGDYYIFPDTGNYTLSIPNVPQYHILTTPPLTGSFTGYGNVDSLLNFALEPIPGISDLRVMLTPVTRPRTTGHTYMDVAFANVGTDTLAPVTIHFVHSPNFDLISTTTPYANYSNDTITWSIPSMIPGDYGSSRVKLLADTSAQIGDTAWFELQGLPVANDTTPLDNFEAYHDTIIGSYDPNDKRANFEDYMTPAEYSAGAQMDYTIRFQNTGSDTAFTVTIRDTLHNNLDLSTFRVIAYSHPYTVSLTDHALEFRFDNILLPDSFTNEAQSHGFIRYEILPASGLVIGDQFSNTAFIFFDNNPPIVTNTVNTRIDTVPSVGISNPIAPVSFELYPNPTEGQFMLGLNLEKAEQVEIGILDLQGREMLRYYKTPGTGLQAIPMDIHSLPNGTYFVRLRTQAGTVTRKLILMR